MLYLYGTYRFALTNDLPIGVCLTILTQTSNIDMAYIIVIKSYLLLKTKAVVNKTICVDTINSSAYAGAVAVVGNIIDRDYITYNLVK